MNKKEPAVCLSNLIADVGQTADPGQLAEKSVFGYNI